MNIRAVCPQVTWESLSEMSGMQRISNKMPPLVDIRSTAGLSPWLVTPPLFSLAGTGTANGFYWVGHGAA